MQRRYSGDGAGDVFFAGSVGRIGRDDVDGLDGRSQGRTRLFDVSAGHFCSAGCVFDGLAERKALGQRMMSGLSQRLPLLFNRQLAGDYIIREIRKRNTHFAIARDELCQVAACGRALGESGEDLIYLRLFETALQSGFA